MRQLQLRANEASSEQLCNVVRSFRYVEDRMKSIAMGTEHVLDSSLSHNTAVIGRVRRIFEYAFVELMMLSSEIMIHRGQGF
jgi:hypothetical protein